MANHPLYPPGLAQMAGAGVAGNTIYTGPNWGNGVATIAQYPGHAHTFGPYMDPYYQKIIEEVAEKRRLMEMSAVANVRIEQIENGYLVIYGKQGVPEERRFAKDMREVGDAVIAACTKLQLTPASK